MTTTDIARVVGVSQPVVSKVLNGSNNNIGVSEAVRNKILQVARELRYRSNAAARAMRTGRFNGAALLLGAHQATNLLPMSLFHGLVDSLAKNGMHLTVAKLPDAKLVRDDVVSNLLTDWYADGLLINYNAKIPCKLIEFVESYRLPSVWINSKQSADCVYPDDFDALNRLTRYFIESGTRDIAYAGGGTWHYSSKLRVEGYLDAMQAAGLKPRTIDLDLGNEEENLVRLRAFIGSGCPPAAIACYNQFVADCVCRVCEELGVAVGTELRLGAVNDQPFTYRRQTLPTMVLPQRELGAAAVTMLLHKIKQPDIRQTPVKVTCRLEGVDA